VSTDSAAFEGRSISSPRFVWDQAAHQWHGEDCKIVLLALPTVDEQSRGEVEEIIAGRHVTSYTCYLAYGSYDILIRMWCTPYEKDFVVRDLNLKFSYPEMEIFDVVNIDYSRWSSRAAPAAGLRGSWLVGSVTWGFVGGVARSRVGVVAVGG